MDNLGLEKGKVELIAYQENYEDIFKEEKKNLEKIFKERYVIIEHIGSTAIKNIYSKPIIDIVIITNNLEDFKEFAKKNLDSKYTFKEETEVGDFLIRKEEDGKVKAFIHVYPSGSEDAKNCLIFRDYLNNNPKCAREYEKLKIELFKKCKDDRKSYTKGKNDYIKSIIKKAKDEEYR